MNGVRRVSDAARLAERVATAVAGCPSVARLAEGPAATYLPGRTVRGVAVREDALRVAVVAEYGTPLAEVARQVRAAVAGLTPGLRVDVSIDDIVAPGGPARPP